MVFRRRDRLPLLTRVLRFFWPRGGWARAASYIWHRMRRLPDEPHRIARGMFAGIFVSFTPLFGFHFLLAALVGYIIRANILASLLATFLGNPFTFPFIAGSALAMGNWIFGYEDTLLVTQIMAAFSRAAAELWHNLTAVFTGQPAHWTSLERFFERLFLPYLVGGLIPGAIAGLVGYYVTIPLVSAYQRRRRKKLRERFERIRAAMAERAAAEAEGHAAGGGAGGGTEGGPAAGRAPGAGLAEPQAEGGGAPGRGG